MSLLAPNEYRRLLASMETIGDDIRSIASRKSLEPEDVTRLADLEAEFDRLSVADKEHRRAALTASVDPLNGRSVEYVRESGHTPTHDLDGDPIGEPASAQVGKRRFDNPWSIATDEYAYRHASPADWRSRALDAVEKTPGANAANREAMTAVLDEFDDKHARLSRIAVLTSQPAYVRWFGEMLKTGGLNPLLSAEEQTAARRVRDEARAMGLTDSAGGALIPFQLDPAVVNTSDGSSNPIRRVARRVVATGDTWNGVSADATSWSWDSEAEEVSDDASTFAQPSITIHAARGFVPISFEAFEDAANVTEEIQRLLSFGRATLEETAFVTGTGTGEPFGIVTALTGTASVVNATTNDSFGFEDVYALDEALPARFRRSARAAWFAHRSTLNTIDQMESANGAPRFPGVVGNPGTLLGLPAYEAEAMDGALATGDDYLIAVGDWDHYVIADRSSSVEFIPHLFGGSGQRPTGQRGVLGWFRTGADSIHDGAFRMLKV